MCFSGVQAIPCVPGLAAGQRWDSHLDRVALFVCISLHIGMDRHDDHLGQCSLLVNRQQPISFSRPPFLHQLFRPPGTQGHIISAAYQDSSRWTKGDYPPDLTLHVTAKMGQLPILTVNNGASFGRHKLGMGPKGPRGVWLRFLVTWDHFFSNYDTFQNSQCVPPLAETSPKQRINKHQTAVQ